MTKELISALIIGNADEKITVALLIAVTLKSVLS